MSNSRQTALYFTNKEEEVQIIIVRSGFEAEETGPIYHVIVESGKDLKTTVHQLSASEILELTGLEVDPDKFTQELIPNKIITPDQISTKERRHFLSENPVDRPSGKIITGL